MSYPYLQDFPMPDRDDFLVVDYDNILENRKHNYVKRTNTKTEDFDAEYPDDVDTGLTPFDVSSVLMYPPAQTVVHTKNEEQAIKYHSPPIISWPNPKTEDLLSAIDKVEVSLTYGCEIGQTLMVDYINLNRLSTVSRLENVTKDKIKNGSEKDVQCQVLSDEMNEIKASLEKELAESKATIGKLENKVNKQFENGSVLDEQK